ncbi:MAG: recombinase [Lachnospiraceae bacterium]|nr:recombinase [Lachnospiraceae bacterium]
MFDYEKYEEECVKIRKSNAELLTLFEADLTTKGLSQKTVRSHLSNVDFYVNEYLLREEPRPMENGVSMIDMFLGYFFIRKCTWSTPQTIKGTAASIKKFYKCMLDHGRIPKIDYDFLCSEIRDNMEQWQADCAMYNDPCAENPFDWF